MPLRVAAGVARDGSIISRPRSKRREPRRRYLRPTGMEIVDHVGMRVPHFATKVWMSGREIRMFVRHRYRILRRPEALREDEAGEGYRG